MATSILTWPLAIKYCAHSTYQAHSLGKRKQIQLAQWQCHTQKCRVQALVRPKYQRYFQLTIGDDPYFIFPCLALMVTMWFKFCRGCRGGWSLPWLCPASMAFSPVAHGILAECHPAMGLRGHVRRLFHPCTGHMPLTQF